VLEEGEPERHENTLNTKIDPVMGEIGEVDPPIFFALIDMRFEDKVVDTIRLSKETLVILTVMFLRNAGVKT
jgi:hypothetical protein